MYSIIYYYYIITNHKAQIFYTFKNADINVKLMHTDKI